MLTKRFAIFSLLITLFIVACTAQETDDPIVEDTAIPVTATSLPPTAIFLQEPPEPSLTEESTITELEPTAILRTFVIDEAQSIARYRVNEEFFSGAVTRLGKELGMFRAVGWTREIEGQLILNEAVDGALSVDSGRITVEIRTLKSDDDRRDERIQEQYLESNKYPFAEFTVTGVEGFPETYTEGEEVTFLLIGDLTIREITNSETFSITATLVDGQIAGMGTTEILMVDYGFDPPEIVGFMKAQDPATIEIELVATETTSD